MIISCAVCKQFGFGDQKLDSWKNNGNDLQNWFFSVAKKKKALSRHKVVHKIHQVIKLSHRWLTVIRLHTDYPLYVCLSWSTFLLLWTVLEDWPIATWNCTLAELFYWMVHYKRSNAWQKQDSTQVHYDYVLTGMILRCLMVLLSRFNMACLTTSSPPWQYLLTH